MTDPNPAAGPPATPDGHHPRQNAPSPGSHEGGSGPVPPTAIAHVSCEPDSATRTELAQLRIRVVALENLVIALLADLSAGPLDVALGMADHIRPRPGFTRHRLTLRAATQMTHLVERAGHFARHESARPPGPG